MYISNKKETVKPQNKRLITLRQENRTANNINIQQMYMFSNIYNYAHMKCSHM